MRDLERIHVDLGDRAYDVFVGEGLLEKATDFLSGIRSREVIAVVSDANAAALHGPRLREGLKGLGARIEEFAIPSGESSKSISAATTLWNWLAPIRGHTGGP